VNEYIELDTLPIIVAYLIQLIKTYINNIHKYKSINPIHIRFVDANKRNPKNVYASNRKQ